MSNVTYDHGSRADLLAASKMARAVRRHRLASASLPGLTDCYWSDDGTTWTKATAGTPFPIAHVRSGT